MGHLRARGGGHRHVRRLLVGDGDAAGGDEDGLDVRVGLLLVLRGGLLLLLLVVGVDLGGVLAQVHLDDGEASDGLGHGRLGHGRLGGGFGCGRKG